MADLRYVIPNELRRRAHRARTLVLFPGIPAALSLSLLHPLLTLAAGIALVATWNRQNRPTKGAQGEDLALGIPCVQPGSLAMLDDDYIVFNQVRVPWRDTALELDFVVVGRNGVFNVECKHLVGEIVGRDVDRNWVQQKRGSGGIPVTKHARNPVIQVRRSTHALATYLRSCGIDVWVHALVVFTHPAAKLSVSSNAVPVLTLPQLVDRIATFRPSTPFRQQGAAIRALRRLQDPVPGIDSRTAPAETVSGAGGPRHIRYFMRDMVPERIEAFMKHDMRSEIRKQSGPADITTAQPQLPVNRAAVQPARGRRRRLRVVAFAHPVERRRRKTVRTYRREEIFEVEESSDSDGGPD